MPFGIIHLAHNRVNNNVYVRQTTGELKPRAAGHLCTANNGSWYHLHAAIRKCGAASFTFHEIAVGTHQEDLARTQIFKLRKRRTTADYAFAVILYITLPRGVGRINGLAVA
jgi:hypothetical protein